MGEQSHTMNSTPQPPVDTDGPEPAGRAIVTFGRGWHSLAVVRSLAARGVEVISADVYGLTPGALSKGAQDSFTYPDPAETPERFLDVLESEIRARRPDDDRPYVLQPVQQETYLISKHRQRFEGLIDLALPEHELLDRVRDKGELASMASSLGLKVPPTHRFDARPTADELAEIEVPATSAWLVSIVTKSWPRPLTGSTKNTAPCR